MFEKNKKLKILVGCVVLAVLFLCCSVLIFYLMRSNFFQQDGILLSKTCIDSPKSVGCYTCQFPDLGSNRNVCEQCEAKDSYVINTRELGIESGKTLVTVVNGEEMNNILDFDEVVCTQEVKSE